MADKKKRPKVKSTVGIVVRETLHRKYVSGSCRSGTIDGMTGDEVFAKIRKALKVKVRGEQ